MTKCHITPKGGYVTHDKYIDLIAYAMRKNDYNTGIQLNIEKLQQPILDDLFQFVIQNRKSNKGSKTAYFSDIDLPEIRIKIFQYMLLFLRKKVLLL